jgi:hypothetical protein
MGKTILSFVVIAMSCLALNSCDKIDDLVLSSDSKITVGTTDYKISLAFQGVTSDHLGLAFISDGLTYDVNTSKFGGNGVVLVIDTPASSSTATWTAGSYTVISATSDIAAQTGQVYVGYATITDGQMESEYYLTSGTLKVTKTDSKYTFDLSGVAPNGTKVTTIYSGILLVASIPSLAR